MLIIIKKYIDKYNIYMNITKLYSLSLSKLIILCNNLGIKNYTDYDKQILINILINYFFHYKNSVYVTGILEIIPFKFGFIRFKDYSYISSKNDIFVSPFFIKKFKLKNGDTILGKIRIPIISEKYLVLIKIIAINYNFYYKNKIYFNFNNLTPLHANYKFSMTINKKLLKKRFFKKKDFLKLKNYLKIKNNIKKKFFLPISFIINSKYFNNLLIFNKKNFIKYKNTLIKNYILNNNLIGRILDLTVAIGRGQRGLIIAPPKAGKTILLQHIAKCIGINNPDCLLIVLLIDERPEEVTEMKKIINKIGGEVIYSTFDECAYKHIQISEIVLEKAKRLVENKKNVVILLDSLTRLTRAYNSVTPISGKVLTGGIDSNALYKPKKFFGSARNIEEGGSLTVIATALIDTGSKMDDIIFEEFKGTGNMEIYLSRKIANKRVFPAIDYKKSGARREDLLIIKNRLKKI